LLGLVLFAVFTFFAAFAYFNSPPAFLPDSFEGREDLTGFSIELDGSGQAVAHFEVYRGESAKSVGSRLADLGLIRSRLFWQMLCRYSGEYIKTGSYSIDIPSNQMAIHRLLISGRQVLLRVTVPEGFTLNKTARLLESAGICSMEDFLNSAADPEIIGRYRIPGPSMEGYLYPDTYLFPADYPAARVVQTMADTFFSRIETLDEKMISMTPEELNKIVILASIVEREYRIDEEAPLMAGVFSRRMEIGMALQSCATVEYIITEIQGKPHPEVITGRDIEIRDPYNTYIRPGLPPGPISAPGITALNAALNPTKTDYLYFRLIEEDSGKHYFSRTLDDHIRAGRLFTKRSAAP
jgi:UPF0755 protein